MDPSGFEPEAPALQGRCSTGLSYKPKSNSFWLFMNIKKKTVGKLIGVDKKNKEVIQPQVPLRLPCDDLSRLTELKFTLLKKVSFT